MKHVYGVRVATKSCEALDLIKYQTLITTAFQDYSSEACIQYDHCFRQLAAKTQRTGIGHIQRRPLWCYSSKPASAGSFHADKPANLSCLGYPQALPLTQLQGQKSASCITTPVAAQRMGAKYKYVCSKRGSEGDQPAISHLSKHQPS